MLVTLCMRDLHFHEKKTKEQARARRSKREGKKKKYYTFYRFLLALTPDFPSYISLLLQPRDLILFLSLDFYVPEIQKLEML